MVLRSARGGVQATCPRRTDRLGTIGHRHSRHGSFQIPGTVARECFRGDALHATCQWVEPGNLAGQGTPRHPGACVRHPTTDRLAGVASCPARSWPADRVMEPWFTSGTGAVLTALFGQGLVQEWAHNSRSPACSPVIAGLSGYLFSSVRNVETLLPDHDSPLASPEPIAETA